MEKVSVLSIQKKKSSKTPITALTCYDAATAQLLEEAGIDIALVGDSLANTRLGYANTLPVTVEEMLHHVKAASRGVRRSFLVADLPFQSYEWAPWQAAKTAGLFVKEGGAKAVKVEGGRRIGESVRAILKSNIPVMGHVGLTPQFLHRKGGYFVQGRTPDGADDVLHDALYLQEVGVFSVVLEGIPAELGKRITRELSIPTIGIGAGPFCDGQILVLDDLLGLHAAPPPRFVKQYARLHSPILHAIQQYRRDVQRRRFPTKKHAY